jgi:uncharacterized protein
MSEFGTIDFVVFVIAIMLAYAVRGGAGFGGGMVAVPLLALVAPLHTVVPVVSALNMTSAIRQGFRDWRMVAWSEMRRILPFAIFGVVVGIWLLARVDPRPLRRIFGCFIVLYALYSLLAPGHKPDIPHRWLTLVAAVASTLAGIVGSLFGGAAGPVFVMYFSALRLEKDRFRASMTMLMLTLGTTRLFGFAAAGMYTRDVLTMILAGLPLMLLGGYVGGRIVRRLDQARFNRAVGYIILASGLLLILK